MSRQLVSECRLAVDIMSGDESPRFRVRAAVNALKDFPQLYLYLVGDSVRISSYLKDSTCDQSRVEVVHGAKVVPMDERPSMALRGKAGSSMWLAVKLVADGKADACVSSGNTGALMAMGRSALKTLIGVDRPAIAATLPCYGGVFLLLDIGANVDCTPAHLYQFAVMGAQRAVEVGGISSPRVGLLNIGTEDIKGCEQVRLANQLIKEDSRINYVGYIEGHDIFKGRADVVVCDGFVGNVALKTGEGVACYVLDSLRSSFQQTFFRRGLVAMIAPMIKKICKNIDPVRYNGAVSLGLQGTIVKSHGSAREEGFCRAIHRAVAEVDAVCQVNYRPDLQG